MTFVSVDQNVICPIKGRREVGGNEGKAAEFMFFHAAAIFNELSCHYRESERIRDLKGPQKFNKGVGSLGVGSCWKSSLIFFLTTKHGNFNLLPDIRIAQIWSNYTFYNTHTHTQFHELTLIDSRLPPSSWRQSITSAAHLECNTASSEAGCLPASASSPHLPHQCQSLFERVIIFSSSPQWKPTPLSCTITSCKWTQNLPSTEGQTAIGSEHDSIFSVSLFY